jgi:hypothetical protein
MIPFLSMGTIYCTGGASARFHSPGRWRLGRRPRNGAFSALI